MASRDAAGAHGESCIGVLSYLFDHERRDLARRLVHTHHDHHALNLSTLHLHLDASRCLEVAVLQGRAAQLRAVADQVSAERGVRLAIFAWSPKRRPRHSARGPHHRRRHQAARVRTA